MNCFNCTSGIGENEHVTHVSGRGTLCEECAASWSLRANPDLGKSLERFYYRGQEQACGNIPTSTDLRRAFANWPEKPQVWELHERGARRVEW